MSRSPRGPKLHQLAGQALRAVLGTLLGSPAEKIQPVDQPPAETIHGRFSARVMLSGPHVSGSVQCGVPRGFAERALVQLLGISHPASISEAEVDDFAGEFCNMLAGQVAAQLRLAGWACALSPPAVGIEPHPLPDPGPGTERCRTDWTWEEHRLTLVLQLHCGPT